jgi:hypothetical protein
MSATHPGDSLSGRPASPWDEGPEAPPPLPEVAHKAPDEPPGFFDKPSNIRAMKWIAVLVVVVLTTLDFFLPYHETVGGEEIPGWYTVFGFVTSVALIVMAKIGASLLKREEDYYG